jgi:hypothetical protein
VLDTETLRRSVLEVEQGRMLDKGEVARIVVTGAILGLTLFGGVLLLATLLR